MHVALAATTAVQAFVAARPRRVHSRASTVCQAQNTKDKQSQVDSNPLGLGDVLGPIGITVGGEIRKEVRRGLLDGRGWPAPQPRAYPLASAATARASANPWPTQAQAPSFPISGKGTQRICAACMQSAKKHKKEGAPQIFQRAADAAGLSLGPIGLTVGSDLMDSADFDDDSSGASEGMDQSISALTTEEWRQKYEDEQGRVDLWVEEEFNSGSRLVVGPAGQPHEQSLETRVPLSSPGARKQLSIDSCLMCACRVGGRCTMAARRATCRARAWGPAMPRATR